MTPDTKVMVAHARKTSGRDMIILLLYEIYVRLIEYVERLQLTVSSTSPSPPTYTIVRSASALYCKSATTAEIILEAENKIASKPAIREISSKPGKEINVTEALNMIAA